MRIWYDNEANKGTITAESEETGYPAINLQNTQLSRTTRSTNVSSVQTWDWDAGAGVTIAGDSISILGHNISSAATAIQFIMAATSTFAGATTSVVLTHNAGLMSAYFAADSQRYSRVLIDDSSNSDEYIEMGAVFIASYLHVTGGVGVDFPFQVLDSSTGGYSNTGQFFGDEGDTLDLYSFAMPFINNALKKSFITMFNEVKTVKPIIMDFNESAHSSILPLYCRFNEPISYNHIPVPVSGTDWDFHWNASISLKEIK